MQYISAGCFPEPVCRPTFPDFTPKLEAQAQLPTEEALGASDLHRCGELALYLQAPDLDGPKNACNVAPAAQVAGEAPPLST